MTHWNWYYVTREIGMSDEMYAENPSIASDPIYIGEPTDLTDLDDTPVRVWSDQRNDWIDDEWIREAGSLRFEPSVEGTVRVCQMVDVDEHDSETDYT